MFDRYTDAFMNGHFQLPITIATNDDGSHTAIYERPDNNELITATADDAAEANRRCTDAIRAAVLDGSLQLGR